MKALVLIHALLVSTVAFSIAARAQNNDAIVRVIKEITAEEAKLSAAQRNILEMQKSLRGNEYDMAQIAQDTGSYVLATMSAVDSLGPLVSQMEKDTDRARVVASLRIDVKASIVACATQVKYINQVLATLTKPAVVAEVTKLRDSLIRLRGLLEQLPHADVSKQLQSLGDA